VPLHARGTRPLLPGSPSALTPAQAQDHGEASGHADFAESTEAVLALVCQDCGKPCRSETEQKIHTQRTGHASFVDKTAEVAKPVVRARSAPRAGC